MKPTGRNKIKVLFLLVAVMSFMFFGRFIINSYSSSFSGFKETPTIQYRNFESIFPPTLSEWLFQYRQESHLILIEPSCVECMHDRNETSCVECRRLSKFRFAFRSENHNDTKFYLLQIVLDSIPSGWQYGDIKSNFQSIELKKSSLTILVSVLEKRPNYWYISGSAQEPARAFLGLQLLNFDHLGKNRSHLLVPSPVDFYIWQFPKSTFLQCNRTSAEYLKKKHPTLYEKPVIDDSFVNDLAYLRDIMFKNRITFMLSCGTALGWYRECGFIPHTSDVDTAFLASEWNPKLENILKTDSYMKLMHIIGRPRDSLELVVMAKNGIKVDIFALYELKNETYISGVDAKDRTILRWSFPPFVGACTADLKGHLFFVRCDALQALIAEYGPVWYEHHHSSNFTWHSSHRNVKRIGQYSKEEWPSIWKSF